MQQMPSISSTIPSCSILKWATVGLGVESAARKYAISPMSFLVGAAVFMISASKPEPAMMMKPWRWSTPSLSVQKISPMSIFAVLPSRQALASAAASGALPMLLKKRFAVPEGKIRIGTSQSRSWSSTLDTVPSPPDTTTRSKLLTSRTQSSGSMPSPIKRMTTSSPLSLNACANANISSELGPDARLWIIRQRMRVFPYLKASEYSMQCLYPTP